LRSGGLQPAISSSSPVEDVAIRLSNSLDGPKIGWGMNRFAKLACALSSLVALPQRSLVKIQVWAILWCQSSQKISDFAVMGSTCVSINSL